jgi:uncharacterized protein (TIGR03083 family)
MDHVSAYQEARRRVAALAAHDPGAVVPAAPAWTVREMVAHLAGLAADWVNGNLDEYASDVWTAAQVDARSGWDLDRVLEEWETAAPQLESILRQPGAVGLPEPLNTAFGPVPAMAWPDIIVTDLALHEHDIRGAVARPGARRSDAVMIAMRSHVGLLRFVGAARRLPVLTLEPTDADRTYAIGRGEPGAAVRAPLFELFRATGGRRSRSQIEALDWSGDYVPWLDHIVMPSYTAPAEPLIE